MTTIHIDPTQLTPQTRRYLASLLRKLDRDGIKDASPQTQYALNMKGAKSIERVNIVLTNAIIQRDRRHPITKKIESRYSVLGPLIAEGTFGEIFDILGTLAFNSNDDLTYKNHKSRIMKIQYHFREQHPLHYAINESELSQLATHLHAKPLTTIYAVGQVTTALVLKKIQGNDLFESIVKEQENYCDFTLDERLQLSINILRAIEEQVLEKGIVHRDLKIENLMIDPDSLQVNVIDYGLARLISEKPKVVVCGTPLYFAPEVFNGDIIDEASDRYTAGLILSELWGAPTRTDAEYQIFVAGGNCPPNLKKVFANPSWNGLNDAHKTKINEIVQALTAFDKQKRPLINSAIKVFDQIRLERKINANPNQAEEIKNAHELAISTRENLKVLAQDPQQHSLQTIFNSIETMVTALGTSSIALEECIDSLGIEEFKKIKIVHKEDLLTVTKKINAELSAHLKELSDLQAKVESVETKFAKTKPHAKDIARWQNLFFDIEAVLFKESRHPLSVDAIVALNASFAHALPLLKQRYQELKNLKPTHLIKIGSSANLRFKFGLFAGNTTPTNNPIKLIRPKRRINQN